VCGPVITDYWELSITMKQLAFSGITIAPNFVKIGLQLLEVQREATDRQHGDVISLFLSLRKESSPPFQTKATIYDVA
jgi:hypothetical protein